MNFAVLGVNAHINFDLAHALIATWRHVAPDGDGPDSAQFHDYRLINDVFEMEMDGLREELDSIFSSGPDGAPWDVGANWLADLVVTIHPRPRVGRGEAGVEGGRLPGYLQGVRAPARLARDVPRGRRAPPAAAVLMSLPF